MGAGKSCDVCHFYPRSPCGERHPQTLSRPHNTKFLSTLSLRRATRLPTALRTPHHRFLSTLSLRRATSGRMTAPGKRGRFLSTLSLRRATVYPMTYGPILSRFLSTLSLRRATACLPACVVGASISIHALLAESDRQS